MTSIYVYIRLRLIKEINRDRPLFSEFQHLRRTKRTNQHALDDPTPAQNSQSSNSHYYLLHINHGTTFAIISFDEECDRLNR